MSGKSKWDMTLDELDAEIARLSWQKQAASRRMTAAQKNGGRGMRRERERYNRVSVQLNEIRWMRSIRQRLADFRAGLNDRC